MTIETQIATEQPADVGKGRTGAQVLVAQLESYGVEYIFGICGHTNIAMLDTLSRSSIEFVICRHEQAAAHAADGYARASGKPGVLLVHVGPGMTNAITGVATAAFDSIPLIAIAGDVPSYYHGRHPHQEVNQHDNGSQADMYRPFVKRAWNVNRVEDLARFAERAFWTATSGRPGAVLLNVPMDVFSRVVPEVAAGPFPLPMQTVTPKLDGETAERIAGLLANAERPLLYIGGGLRGEVAVSALIDLAEHLDVPIAHSLMGKGAVCDQHPLLLGMPGFWGLEYTNDYTLHADVVLAVGTRFAETDASSWMPDQTWAIPSSRLIQIDIDPDEIGRNYPVEIGVIADVSSAVPALAAAARAIRPEGIQRPALRAQIAQVRGDLWERTRELGSSDAFPLRPERILQDLLDTLPADAILVTDVGWNKNGVAQCYNLPAQGRFITPGGFSTMGFGPAAALGVQIAQPDRPVIALVGDGGMGAQLSAVPTAVERGLPIIWVVMNNRAHGTIADLEQGNYGHSYGCTFTDPSGETYSPDFAAYARACGAEGYAIGSPEELATALEKSLIDRRPAVLDVPMVNEPVPTPGHWNILDIYQGRFDQP
jgi:acetolactate synthase-1/2/3 large subunit